MISAPLQMALADAKVDDLRRTATARNLTHQRAWASQPDRSQRSVMLRFATPADQPALERLAELDSAKPPAQPVLLAEVDGVLLGALGLSDGSVIADPFHHTADLVALLRARARQLDGNQPRNRRFGLRSWSRVRRLAWR
jgi:hypothetical protein